MEKVLRDFYNSKAWHMCRENYINNMPIYKRGLCEECYSKGKYVIGRELHHKIELTTDNVNNPRIALNQDNLMLLCRNCHEATRHRKTKRRYRFDKDGNVIPPYL